LHLQNNSALAVEVTPEAYSCILSFKIIKNLVVELLGWYIDKCINNYSRVKPEDIIKQKDYMHHGLSISKPSTTRPHFSPTTPILHKIQSSSTGQNNIITSEIATNPLLLQICN